jgi:transposase
VHLELENPDMTRSLLWEEYRLRFKGMLEKAIGYQQFTRLYKSWFSKSKLSMIQNHLPGDKIFVDFCGRTVEIIDQSTGEIRKAQIFVGVLGASGLIFCTAVASQKVADWILCNVRMLNYFGGVPNQIVSDNLKSAVISNTKKIKTINKSFLETSLHFDFVVMPARPRKPQDKALAEAAVKIVQRWALAKLRNSVFFSLEELNDALSRELEILNNKKTKRYPDGRFYEF